MEGGKMTKVERPNDLQIHDLKVIDFHVHFPVDEKQGRKIRPSPEYEEEYGPKEKEEKEAQRRYYHEEWLKAWSFPYPSVPPFEESRISLTKRENESECLTLDDRVNAWAREVDKYNFLDKVVFVTGGGNERLSKIVSQHQDKFIGFAHHSPFEQGAADKLRRGVEEQGLKGYKILPPYKNALTHKSAEDVWKIAAELDIPVLIHFGALAAGGGRFSYQNNNPLTLEPIAQRFPTLQFVIPHFGAGFHQELLYLCWACKNVHVDTSGSNQWIRWTFNLTLEDLFRKFLETVGPDRIVFGSDSSWFPRGFSVRYLTEQIRICKFLNLNYTEMQMIFGGNAANLLGIDPL